MSTKAKGHVTALMTFCLILLFNPNFNIIDIFPDCIAYFLLAALAGKHADHVPYFAEVRSGCLKLGVLTAIKIPAMLIMMANMSTGLDIVPLFSLIFATLELALLLPLIGDTFSAVFYVGERGNLPSTIREYKILFIIKISPDFLRTFTKLFVILKAALSFIPELCHLTFDTDTVMAKLRAIYPGATVISLFVVLLTGVVWLILAHGYVRAIGREGGIASAAREIAGEEKLARLERERTVRRKMNSVSLLFYSSVLVFDITFSGVNNGVNILPRFLFAIAICIISYNLFDSKVHKRSILALTVLFAAVSIVRGYMLTEFKEKYEYRDLLDFKSAEVMYEPVVLWSVIECVVFLAFITVFAVALIKFVASHTGTDENSPGYGRGSLLFAKRMRRRTIIFTAFPALIAIMKAIEVFLLGKPQLIYTEINDGVSSAITASSIPWFGFAIVAVSTVFILYSYSYLTELKEEIGIKYSDEYTVY